MFIADLPTLDSLGQQVATALIVIGTILLDRFVAWLRNKKYIKKAKTSLETIESEIVEIRKELSLNGGGSVKDVVVDTNKTIDTLRKSISSLIAQNKARFKEGVNIIPDPIAVTDDKGQWAYVNVKMQDLLGLTNEQTLKYGWLRPIKDPVQKENIREGWLYSINNLISFSAIIPISNAKTGENYNIELISDPSLDDNGNLLWFYVKAKKI